VRTDQPPSQKSGTHRRNKQPADPTAKKHTGDADSADSDALDESDTEQAPLTDWQQLRDGRAGGRSGRMPQARLVG
jgi:hypothetical protein